MPSARKLSASDREAIVDAAGTAPQIEELLPRAARHRQLSARTLLIGMHLTAADGRPAHLTRVRQALTSLPDADQERLHVTVTCRVPPSFRTADPYRIFTGKDGIT